uniref:Uncharacterized protein n=1 Tax=Arundo donax TaxID=35708 RepID=A0A0A8YX52_ARUDO
MFENTATIQLDMNIDYKSITINYVIENKNTNGFTQIFQTIKTVKPALARRVSEYMLVSMFSAT